MLRFVLLWGLLYFGTVLLVAAIMSTLIASWLFEREMAASGVEFRATIGDMLPFVPRLLAICGSGGALLGVILWFAKKAAFRRANQRAAGA